MAEHTTTRHTLDVTVWLCDDPDSPDERAGAVAGAVALLLAEAGLDVDVTHTGSDRTSVRIVQDDQEALSGCRGCRGCPMADRGTRALLRPSDPKVSGCEDCRVLPHRLTTRAEAERRAGRHADRMAHATYVENPQEHEEIPASEGER